MALEKTTHGFVLATLITIWGCSVTWLSIFFDKKRPPKSGSKPNVSRLGGVMTIS